MDAQADFLQGFLGVEIFPLAVVGHEFFFTQRIEVAHNRVIGWFHPAVIGGIRDPKPGVQLGKQDFDGVELYIRKIFITSEKVFQIGDVLA